MTTTYLKYLIAGLCIGSIACGEDSVSPSGKKSSSDSVEDDSDDETTDDGEEETPRKKDAGKATVKKDAGRPPADDDEEEEPAEDEDVDVPVKDAGKKPVVDAGSHDHADAGWSAPDASAGGGSGMAAQDFCDAYGMYCGYNKAQRHKDEAACLADFNGNPAQQGCKIMHLSTSIAGTAAACNGMQSAFCFSIHCLHAAGLTDQTGVTYCK